MSKQNRFEVLKYYSLIGRINDSFWNPVDTSAVKFVRPLKLQIDPLFSFSYSCANPECCIRCIGDLRCPRIAANQDLLCQECFLYYIEILKMLRDVSLYMH